MTSNDEPVHKLRGYYTPRFVSPRGLRRRLDALEADEFRNPYQVWVYSRYCRAEGQESLFALLPLWLVIQASNGINKAITWVESKIGPRPSLKAAATIEAALGWTPDPTSEIVAVSLALFGVSVYGAEQVFGKERIDRIGNVLTSPFNRLSGAFRDTPLFSKISDGFNQASERYKAWWAQEKEEFNDMPSAWIYGLKF